MKLDKKEIPALEFETFKIMNAALNGHITDKIVSEARELRHGVPGDQLQKLLVNEGLRKVIKERNPDLIENFDHAIWFIPPKELGYEQPKDINDGATYDSLRENYWTQDVNKRYALQKDWYRVTGNLFYPDETKTSRSEFVQMDPKSTDTLDQDTFMVVDQLIGTLDKDIMGEFAGRVKSDPIKYGQLNQILSESNKLAPIVKKYNTPEEIEYLRSLFDDGEGVTGDGDGEGVSGAVPTSSSAAREDFPTDMLPATVPVSTGPHRFSMGVVEAARPSRTSIAALDLETRYRELAGSAPSSRPSLLGTETWSRASMLPAFPEGVPPLAYPAARALYGGPFGGAGGGPPGGGPYGGGPPGGGPFGGAGGGPPGGGPFGGPYGGRGPPGGGGGGPPGGGPPGGGPVVAAAAPVAPVAPAVAPAVANPAAVNMGQVMNQGLQPGGNNALSIQSLSASGYDTEIDKDKNKESLLRESKTLISLYGKEIGITRLRYPELTNDETLIRKEHKEIWDALIKYQMSRGGGLLFKETAGSQPTGISKRPTGPGGGAGGGSAGGPGGSGNPGGFGAGRPPRSNVDYEDKADYLNSLTQDRIEKQREKEFNHPRGISNTDNPDTFTGFRMTGKRKLTGVHTVSNFGVPNKRQFISL